MSRKTLYQLGPPKHQGDAFSRRHPPMAVKNRAKIFAPFAALPPYARALNNCREEAVLVKPPEISEDAAAQINASLTKLLIRLKKEQSVSACLSYFKFSTPAAGSYHTCRASIVKTDAAAKTLTFMPQSQNIPRTVAFSQLCWLDLD
ncbi:MAG: hypothetical protein ACI39G_00705 [Pseudoramibacter sp.]